MYLNQWSLLNLPEKKIILADFLIKYREINWFQDFERYIMEPESLDMLDAFIEVTKQYYKTHNHFGGKAIMEILRYRTCQKDASTDFKINNNYTCDVTRLVRRLFMEELSSFFEERKQRLVA